MEENVKPISQLLQTVGYQLINAAANKNFNTFRSGIRHLDELLRNFYSDFQKSAVTKLAMLHLDTWQLNQDIQQRNP